MFDNIRKVLAISALTLLSFTSSAHAVTAYDFGSIGFGVNLLNPGATNNLFAATNSQASVARIVYDEVAKTARLTISGKASVSQRAGAAQNWAVGQKVVDSTDFSFVMDFFNVIPITNPTGLLGFTGTGASSIGTYTINNIGDVTGDGVNDSASFQVAATFMNFANALNDGVTNYKDELAHLGSANFFLWNSTIFSGISAKAWLSGSNNVLINGVLRNDLFPNVSGDISLNGGTVNTQVPEPATAMLLGLGAMGGALRRRKSS